LTPSVLFARRSQYTTVTKRQTSRPTRSLSLTRPWK